MTSTPVRPATSAFLGFSAGTIENPEETVKNLKRHRHCVGGELASAGPCAR